MYVVRAQYPAHHITHSRCCSGHVLPGPRWNFMHAQCAGEVLFAIDNESQIAEWTWPPGKLDPKRSLLNRSVLALHLSRFLRPIVQCSMHIPHPPPPHYILGTCASAPLGHRGVATRIRPSRDRQSSRRSPWSIPGVVCVYLCYAGSCRFLESSSVPEGLERSHCYCLLGR